ncbi:MAG: copper chaperone PCu(A)C [Polynucleobacter sp.]|nr:copper chaperone PCu(A)C [Polynucleobacter sp.]
MKTTIQLKSLITSAALMFVLPSIGFAQEAKVGSIAVNGAYTRATVPGQAAAGGFMKITSSGAADQLISATSTVSDDVQLHTMTMDNNVMRMREVKQIEVPANGAVELKPGGLHLMFMNIKAPLKAGELVPVKLKFAKAGEVEIKMPVNAPGGHGHGPKH